MTTPWIDRQYRNLIAYQCKIYTHVTKNLSPAAQEVAKICEEFYVLNSYDEQSSTDSENQLRNEAVRNEHKECCRRILIRLAQFRMEIENVNTILRHHLYRAEYMTRAHVSAYWSGVLQMNDSGALPSMPLFDVTDAAGEQEYEGYLNSIRRNFAEILENEGGEADETGEQQKEK